MQKLTDEEIIYNAFRRYAECCSSNKAKMLSQGKAIQLRAELLQQAEKYYLFFNSGSTTQLEKNNLCNKCRKLYQQYSVQVKVNPEVDTPRLAKRVDELLHFMAECEAEILAHFRNKQVSGDKIDLEQVFADGKNVNALMSKSVDKLLKDVFDKRKYSVIGSDQMAIYMTAAKGTRYHIKDCQYCRNKEIIQVSIAKAVNIGLKPCKCIEKREKEIEVISDDAVQFDEQAEHLKSQEASKKPVNNIFVTAFVDESIRPNPWHELDKQEPEKYATYSYIICKGKLISENQIRDNKILHADVMQSEKIDKTHGVAIEAIQAVLFKLIADGYSDNVVIYTDNTSAKDLWNRSVISKRMARIFVSVTVCYIPREQNTRADMLSRTKVFTELSVETATDIIRKCKEHKELSDDIRFVKKFFPRPKENIINLMSELSMLAKGGCDGVCIT